MLVGMLWLDTSNIPLAQKVQKAADYYCKKYGRQPDMCLVHPSLFSSEHGRPGAEEQGGLTVNNVLVRPWRSVLPGHLWIGVEEAPKEVE